MATTSYTNSTFSASVLGARTDSSGVAVSDLSAEESRFFFEILTEGYIKPDNSFKVQAQAVPDMTVKVGSQTAKADYYVVSGDTVGQGNYIIRLDSVSQDVTIDASDASQARTDEIYLVVRDNVYDASSLVLPQIGYRKGDVGGAAPGPDSSWEAHVLLATISVGAAVTSIETANITDERTESTVIPELSSAGSFSDIDLQVFTSSGTWNKPTGASEVWVQVGGAGGGGGGGDSIGGAGGGGAGGYSAKLFSASSLSSSVAVTVGAGGSGGTSGGDGGIGGSSSFSTVSSGGGDGGASLSAGGESGIGSGGDISMGGGSGGWPSPFAGQEVGGMGGASFFGGGGSGTLGANPADDGTSYGSGGGGAGDDAGGTGGDGADGIVIVTTYITN